MPEDNSLRKSKISRCVDPTIGQRIVMLRKARRLSRNAVAAASGLSVKTITKYEQAERIPGLVNAVKLARGLRCDLPDLCFLPLDLSGDDFPAAPVRSTGRRKRS